MKGSTWHGILGSRMKQLFCLYPHTSCTGCSHRSACGYVDFFEPHLQSSEEQTPSSFQKGFVLRDMTDMRKQFQPGDLLTVGLVFVGRIQKYLPLLVADFSRPFRIGKVPFTIQLSEVRQLQFAKLSELVLFREGQLILAPTSTNTVGQLWKLAEGVHSNSVQLNFLTPTRMKTAGRLNKAPNFEQIVQALIRKLNAFAVHFGDGRDVIGAEHYQELMKNCRSLHVVENSLRWVDWKRYSRRSEETMTLGGFIGTLTVSGNLKPLLPLLLLGEYLHVGKQASFGLGQYRCQFV
ncbi:CRISPR system precrRNA processing endoribonuclease RAMP protein Cas6 [Tumebacillus flagellatus]|nr:CRISPR system precrRNA processing endoribonuclease RAMP protein Cas6 [Tumebacillus flagellatus]